MEFSHTGREVGLQGTVERAARRTQVEAFTIQRWENGWRPNIQKTNLPAQSVYDLQNVVWNDDYTISKRKGYRQIADDTVSGLAAADFVLAPRVYTTSGLFPQYSQQILHFNKDDGELFYTSLGEMWKEFQDPTNGDDLAWSNHSIGAASDTVANRFRVWPITAVTFGSKIYMTTLRYGGYDNNTTTGNPTSGDWQTETGNEDSHSLPIIYDVQAGTFSRPAVNDLDGNEEGKFIGARTMIAKYARIFAANVFQEGVYRYPSRIYWCGTDDEPDQPTLWESLNYIDVGADDGQEVVRLLSFGDQILVFKNQSIWALVGTDDTTFALYQLDDQLGTEGTYASCATAGEAYFLDERTGVWRYNGESFDNVSDPIKEELLGNLNREAAYKVVMVWHDEKVYVSIPTGTQSSATNSLTYVYDTELETWTKYDYGFVPHPFPMYSDLNVTDVTTSLSNNLFGGLADAGVFEFNTGLNDDGAAISSYFTTPWMNPGNLSDRHRLRKLELITDEDDHQITIDVFTDLEFDSAKTSISFDPATGTQNVLEVDQSVDDFLWTYLCLRFTQNGDDEDMNLYTLGLTTSTRPTPRGIITSTGYSA